MATFRVRNGYVMRPIGDFSGGPSTPTANSTHRQHRRRALSPPRDRISEFRGQLAVAVASLPVNLAVMDQQRHKPIIGVPADIKPIDGAPFHAVGDKYLRAIIDAADAVPLVIPAFGDWYDLRSLLNGLDGVLFTGSPSNVHPGCYDTAPTPEAEPYDEARDATTLPMIREALTHEVPFLAICRGMQELNVALGGTLHPRVHEIVGREDHRRPQHEDRDVQYGPRHSIQVRRGGPFEALAGSREIEVNSLHWQAVDRISERLEVEALAPDGTIEAVSVKDAPTFALGVQWHPEYKVLETPFSVNIFKAFGTAARCRAESRGARRETDPTLRRPRQAS